MVGTVESLQWQGVQEYDDSVYEAINRGLADIEAGRVMPADEAFAKLKKELWNAILSNCND